MLASPPCYNQDTMIQDRLAHLIQQRDYLLDISRALTSQLSLTEVLRRILESATDMLGGQAGLIALADAGDETFTVRASYGIPAAVLHLFAPLLADIPHSDPESFVVPELNDKMRLVGRAAGMGLHQVVALPMAVGNELVGVVYIFRAQGGNFTTNEVRLLQSFADQAAIAVHNARLYEQVTAERRRLDAILRHSADGIMILHPNLTVESINLALARMTGRRVDEARGVHHDRLIRWARLETETDLQEAIEGGWPADEQSILYVEGDLIHSSDSTISVGITYAPLFDSRGELRNIVGNVRDITKFREAEEAKSTFISVISHELKTPVSVIKGYASTLNREDVNWDQATLARGLSVIDEETDKLSELIDNLLDVSRLQIGTFKLDFGRVNLAEMAHKYAEKFRLQTTKHEIVVDFPPDFPVIQGDARRLGQVLSNLLSNAIKYSPDGGTITVSGKAVPDGVRISVSDEGIGLPLAQQEFIFDRFYRADNALTRETQGVGLGLYIVRSIVEAHGGHIWVESEPGSGTTFHFELPLSQKQASW
jgi:PAS domain S-box-containing protein